MFQTLGYFLELSVSLYFLAIVTLFLINVCEFMPLNRHGDEGKIYIKTPKKTDSEGSASPDESVPRHETTHKSTSKDKLDQTEELKPQNRSSTSIKKKKEIPLEKDEPQEQETITADRESEEGLKPQVTAQHNIDEPTVADENRAQTEVPAATDLNVTAQPGESPELGRTADHGVTSEPDDGPGPTPEPGTTEEYGLTSEPDDGPGPTPEPGTTEEYGVTSEPDDGPGPTPEPGTTEESGATTDQV